MARAAMFSAMSPRTPQLDRTLDHLWHLIAGLVALLAGHIGHELTGAEDQSLTRWIRPRLLAVEALARRLLILDALHLPVPSLRKYPEASRKPVQPVKPTQTDPAHSRRPSFALFEPIASLQEGFYIEGMGKDRFGPRILPRIIDICAADSPKASPERTERTNKLADRVAALRLVIDERAAVAARIARRLARAHAPDSPNRKRSPLRPGHPPGSRSRQLPDWLREGLNMIALELRGWPPPPLSISG